MAGYRLDMISEEIKRELCDVIRTLKDPRIPEFVSVVAVKVTKDLKYAKVFVSSIENDEKKLSDMVKGLQSSSGYIRREIKNRILLRYTPEFTFVLDDSIKQGAHINDIIHRMDIKSDE